MLTKENLKLFYNLHKSIKNTENELIPSKYIEGWWFWLEDIWKEFYELYNAFEEEKEYSMLERLNSIADDMYTYDTSLLTPEDIKHFSHSYGTWSMKINDDWSVENEYTWENKTIWILMTNEFYEKCHYCKVEFKNIDEIIDFLFL